MAAWLRVLASIFFLPLLVAWQQFITHDLHATWWIPFNIAAWPMVLYASLALHELGHALVGSVLNLRPQRIYFGVGRELARFRLGSLELILNTLPLLGLTMLGPRGASFVRLRMFFAIAAGPAVTAALAWMSLKMSGASSFWNALLPAMVDGPAVWNMALFANALMLMTNLMPVRLSSGPASDGALLLSLPFMREASVKEWLVAHLLGEAWSAIERKEDVAVAIRLTNEAIAQYPDSLAARNMLAVIDLQQERFADARTKWLALLQSEQLEPTHRWLVSINIAWTNYLLADPALLDEADAMSKKVAEDFGSAAVVLGIRGAVLVWRGEVEAGCELLERAYLTNISSAARACNACCLVSAYAKRGDHVRAVEWLEKARRDDPKCSMIPRAEAALQPSP